MILHMLFFFLLLSIEPLNTIQLDRVYNIIEIQEDRIYLASFFGKSIFVLDDSSKVQAIAFTDDVNYRIRNFSVTPFAIYLNNGTTLEKYYTASGIKEEIFAAKDISSFIITPSEEVIIYDRYKHELVFLDFTYNVRLLISDLNIKDLYFADNILYVLTYNELRLYDEHGNVVQNMDTPKKCTNLVVQDSTIILFSSDEKYMYKRNGEWIKIELTHGIRDIVLTNNSLFILDENGTTLYIYSLSHID